MAVLGIYLLNFHLLLIALEIIIQSGKSKKSKKSFALKMLTTLSPASPARVTRNRTGIVIALEKYLKYSVSAKIMNEKIRLEATKTPLRYLLNMHSTNAEKITNKNNVVRNIRRFACDNNGLSTRFEVN
ncbi:MAG TPA: hypothetical protein GXX49_03480 [Clostridiaceae bacterium]|nr:hypothetical protein [Clostridiaceae bacterium]